MKTPVIDRTTLFLAGVSLLLAAVAWLQGGADLALAGLMSGGRLLVSVTPLLLAAFLIAGLTQSLVTQDFVARWLSTGAGWKGIALACVAGALIPGGPYVYYPIAAALLNAGAGIGVLVAFVTAKNLWSVTRLPLEFVLLGPELTIVRFVVTLIIPPVMGILAELLFGHFAERIREAMAT